MVLKNIFMAGSDPFTQFLGDIKHIVLFYVLGDFITTYHALDYGFEENPFLAILMDEFGISYLEKSKAMHLSGGERRRLEIARALIREPKFVLLDEPFAGIDPLAVADIGRIIGKLRAKGIGVIISDHNVRETLSVCDRAYIINEGKLLVEGTPEEIACSEIARKIYFGDDFKF